MQIIKVDPRALKDNPDCRSAPALDAYVPGCTWLLSSERTPTNIGPTFMVDTSAQGQDAAILGWTWERSSS